MKRLLAFLLLLGSGIALLMLAIGNEDAVRANAEQPAEQRPRPVPGVEVQQGKIGATVSQTGPLRLPHFRTIPLPDGREKKEEAFLLIAADSKPVDAGLQQLDGVEVQLFEAGRHAANLLARQAFVELGRDANGRPTLQQDKEIDLRDAVFVTLPGSRMAGLRLELGNAKVKVGELELQVDTATDQPVRLDIDGERKGTLRGKGLTARLPRDRNGALQRVSIEILHEPVLETDGVVVQARGRLHYVEDPAAGTAQVTVDDDVHLMLRRGVALPGMPAAPPTVAGGDRPLSDIRGDQFTGWLLRSKQQLASGREREELVWRRLLLTGAPASVDVAGGRVTTPRITVLPGLFGEPFLITAHGDTRVEQTELRAGGKQKEPVVGTSPRRIHFVQPADLAGPLHRSFGFPQWTLRSLSDLQVVVFEGHSRLESGARTLDAEQGLHVFRSERSSHGIVRGFGDVRIEQRAGKPGGDEVVATGNDGFWLQVTDTSEFLRLGPALPRDLAIASAPWRTHRYDVTYGRASAHGVGACEWERTGERTQLRLRAPAAEIAAQTTAGMNLANVRQLVATLEDRQLVALDAAGLPARTTFVRGNETVTAQAPRFLQIGPQSLRLLMAAADGAAPTGACSPWYGLSAQDAQPILQRVVAAAVGKPAMAVEVRGPQIDIHHLGGSDVLVDAIAADGLRPTVNCRFDNDDGRAPTIASFHAARLRMLPFVMTPEMRQLHTASTGAFAFLAFHSLGRPWLVVDEVRDFRLEDERHGLVEGQGTRLLLSQGAEAGMFVGDPDAMTPAEVRHTQAGRLVTTRGARVRVFRDETLRMQALRTFADRPTFLLPSMTLHEPGENGLLSHMSAVCRGNINVLPEVVSFDGPVVAQGLREDGSDDPDGMHIDARELRMDRQPATRKIVRVVGKDVRIDWSRMNARSAEIELDLRWNRCIASDPNGATVTMPDGHTFSSPRIEVNYDAMSVDCSHGRVDQRSKPARDVR